jgi:hypothetical protein
MALKFQRRMWFMWKDTVESQLIDGLSLSDLIHFSTENTTVGATDDINSDRKCERVAVLSHGFSDVDGPNYPFLAAMKLVLQRLGLINAADLHSNLALS